MVVVVGFCGSIIYTDLQTYDSKLTPAIGWTDTNDYIHMYYGEPATGIRSYRPLVPFLARFVPAPPASLYSAEHAFDRFSRAAAHFAVLNFVFLVGACIVLLIYQEGLGLHRRTAFLGVLLFLGSQTVVRSAGLPMVDAGFFFFFLLCLIAVQRSNSWLLLVGMTVGVLAKEEVLLTIPMIVLSTLPRRTKVQLLAASIPSLAVFALVVSGAGVPLDSAMQPTLRTLMSVAGAADLFACFGLAWIPAGYALLRVDVPPLLRRWSWLLPIVLVLVFVTNASWTRNVFTAFPAVFPLAALGLTEWVRRSIPAATEEPEQRWRIPKPQRMEP